MNVKSAVCTVIAKNYLPFARVLMESIECWAPDLRRFVILVDRVDDYFDASKENFEIIRSEELALPNSRWFHFKYSIVELSTAVKPYALEFLLEKYELENIVFFDPDIKIYNTLQPLFEYLSQHSFVLTPHLTGPICEDDRQPSELDILRAGSYNLGFIALRNCQATSSFLRWWKAHLYEHCVVAVEHGLFVDQRWVDLAPGIFSGVGILRESGYNVAYWNLSHRRIERAADRFIANGSPLYFFHFSGFKPEQPSALSRYQNRYDLADLGEVQSLVLEYGNDLLAHGYDECKNWPYAFGFFENGFPIPDTGRPSHYECSEVQKSVGDPFSEQGLRSFIEIWNQPIAGFNGRPSGLTRLAYRIYRGRSDVQAAMPDILGGDLIRFFNWMLSWGQAEHGLDDIFIMPIRDALQAMEGEFGPQMTQQSPGPATINQKIIHTLEANGIWLDPENGVGRIDNLHELIQDGRARFLLSGLAKETYDSRPDIQRFFPDPGGRDGMRFLLWFLTYGAHEYRLDKALVMPLRQQWDFVVRSIRNPFSRLWHRSVLSAMERSINWRAKINDLIEIARSVILRMPRHR